MAICKVCGVSGAKFCMGCRRRYGGKTVQVTRTVPSRKAKARRPRRPRRASSPRAAAPRRRAAPKPRKHLSKQAFLRKMRAGKLAAAKRRARGGR